MSTRSIAGVAGGLTLFLFLVVPMPPAAGVDGVVVDGASVTAKRAGSGAITASVVLLNTGPVVNLDGTAEGTNACGVELGKTQLPALQSTTIDLTLDAECFEGVSQVEVDLDDGGAMPALTLKKPVEESHDWVHLPWAALIGLVLALAVVLVSALTRAKVDDKQTSLSKQEKEARRQKYKAVTDLVDARIADLGAPQLSWAAVPEPARFGWDAEVSGLDAGWSFKDSWVSNLTVATTGFIALATSVDAFTALLGEEPEAALRVMTVAGLISAALIAFANTVVKLVGKTTSKVTVAGLVVSTSLVVFAATFQIASVGLGAASLLSGFADVVALVLAVAVGGAVVLYAVRALREMLAKGPSDSLPSVPAEALEGWKAHEPWEEKLVEERIRTAFSTWLAPSAQGMSLHTYPIPRRWRATSPGDEGPSRVEQASLL